MYYRLFGAPAVLVSLACFGALRGVQDMRTPLYVAVGINAVNVLLDWLLIFGAGPAAAHGRFRGGHSQHVQTSGWARCGAWSWCGAASG